MVDEYKANMEAAGVEFIYLDEETTTAMNAKLAELAKQYEENGKWPAGTYAELEAIVG